MPALHLVSSVHTIFSSLFSQAKPHKETYHRSTISPLDPTDNKLLITVSITAEKLQLYFQT